MTEETKDDLAVLFPGRSVTCKGEAINVVPLFFGQYPRAGKLAKPFMLAVRDSNMFAWRQSADGATTIGLADGWLEALPSLLEEAGEAAILFFAFCINKPREWFDTLPGDEGIALAQAILEENRDFFTQKVLPKIKVEGLVKTSAGAPSSIGSSPQDTAGPTSSTTP